jgi:hypothetical protein
MDRGRLASAQRIEDGRSDRLAMIGFTMNSIVLAISHVPITITHLSRPWITTRFPPKLSYPPIYLPTQNQGQDR